MKQLFNILFGVLILCTIFNSSAKGQAQKPIYLGASMNYSAEFETSAIKANALFDIFPRISLAPNFIYYLGNPSGAGNIETLIGLNLNGHYKLTTGSNFDVYGIGGLHVSLNKYDNSSASGTDYAVNTGLGMQYAMDQILLFAEGKYMIQSWNTFVFGGGIQFRLN